jgi:hypothetical protein
VIAEPDSLERRRARHALLVEHAHDDGAGVERARKAGVDGHMLGERPQFAGREPGS